MKGAEALVEHVRRNGQRVEWRPNNGGHCRIDAASLASFLVRDPSLETASLNTPRD